MRIDRVRIFHQELHHAPTEGRHRLVSFGHIHVHHPQPDILGAPAVQQRIGPAGRSRRAPARREGRGNAARLRHAVLEPALVVRGESSDVIGAYGHYLDTLK